MSSNVIRLSNGDAIQVRTGTIQGIGPQGPTGPTGSVGPTGPQGEPGERGEVGYVDESLVLVSQGTPTQSVAPSTNTLVDLPTNDQDDFSARQSVSSFALPTGAYVFFAGITFSRSTGTQTGMRAVRLLINGSVVWEQSQLAVTTGTTTSVVLNGGIRVTNAADEITVQVFHTDSVSLALPKAQLWISRIGAGLPGPQGEVGPQGLVGATGATGPQGPAGTISDHNTTFEDIGG